ncbi:MAG TPA: citrate/2-methylcitrate synthase [Actinomycetota bacterium]|nr:citrate/2-methylcitrate synthase [Actinomycetota bacterium]
MSAGRGGDRGGDRLTTAQAAARLGVKPATLYAYVSRGLLGRERAADGRTSTFDPAEVDRLARPGRARRGRRPAGELVVASALTAIDQGLPWYRGLAVPDLAGSRGFEEVAGWLWTGRFPDPSPAWRAGLAALEAGRHAQAALPSAALPLERIQVIAAALAAGDELRLELHPAAVTASGRSLIAGLVDCLPGQGPPAPEGATIAVRLWAGLSPLDPDPGLVGTLDSALVLLADHELAASTVAARVAASVRADPYAVASAGLATVSGTLHGRASLGIEALLAEIDQPDRAASVVGSRLRRGERLRGFGHRLYPDGDPRAAVLLARLRDTTAGSPRLAVVEALLEAAAQRGLPDPSVDLALAALAHVTGMTRGAAEAVFAIARTAGWIAHALEEYERNTPIRPRALYTGPPPGS